MAMLKLHLLLCLTSASERARLDEFSRDFWECRSTTAPVTSDDLPRTAVVRPSGWYPNVTETAFLQQEVECVPCLPSLRATVVTTHASTETIHQSRNGAALASERTVRIPSKPIHGLANSGSISELDQAIWYPPHRYPLM
jgi:hypothetical protein